MNVIKLWKICVIGDPAVLKNKEDYPSLLKSRRLHITGFLENGEDPRMLRTSWVESFTVEGGWLVANTKNSKYLLQPDEFYEQGDVTFSDLLELVTE
jgi:hypothetical protein